MRTRVASLSELPPGCAKEVTVGDRVIAVFNVDGTLYALDGICPHAGGPLAKGRLVGQIVTCPWHGWQFDVTSGRHCLTARIQTGCIAVSANGDDVYVEIGDP
ncbi:MAG: Rieske 2Fe-2S domain-containing protein [Planctomycetaceae bacterium]